MQEVTASSRCLKWGCERTASSRKTVNGSPCPGTLVLVDDRHPPNIPAFAFLRKQVSHGHGLDLDFAKAGRVGFRLLGWDQLLKLTAGYG